MSLLIDQGSEGQLAGATRRVRDVFLRVIQATESNSSSITGPSPQVGLTDALARFQLWLGSVGAVIDGQKKISLEWRLREAPDIKMEILNLLSDLTEALDDMYAFATGQRQNRTRNVNINTIDGDTDSDEVHIDVPAVNEVQDILDSIVECVRSLLRLSILIRRVSPQDRWNKAMQKQNNDRLDDSFDISHVGEKFPKLARSENVWLKIRLGRAITQSRQFIRYCRQHKDQLGGQSTYDQLPAVEGNFQNEIPYPTSAPTLLPSRTGASTKASTLHMSTLEATPDDLDDDGMSDVSSVVSYLDPTDEQDDKLQLPTLQDVSNGHDEFECPLCFMVQSFKHPRKWKKHAYADLKPFVCSGGKGECDLELFPDRETWFSHEIEHHRHHWVCTLCHWSPFDSLARFHAHVQNKHKEILSHHISDYASLCKRPLQLLPAADCPFCDEFDSKLRKSEAERCIGSNQNPGIILVPASNFRRHVASHMEQLALFAMGPSLTFSKPSESGSDASQGEGAVRDTDNLKHYLDSQDEFEQESMFTPPMIDVSEAKALSRIILSDIGMPINGSRDIYAIRYAGSELLRVGTTKDAMRRIKDWEKKCQVTSTVILIEKDIPNARRVEQLVMKEIAMTKKRVECQCGVIHQEIFDAPSQQVIKSITRWIDFIRRDPYDIDGLLKHIWRQRLLELNPEHEAEWDHFVSLI